MASEHSTTTLQVLCRVHGLNFAQHALEEMYERPTYIRAEKPPRCLESHQSGIWKESMAFSLPHPTVVPLVSKHVVKK